MDVNMEDAQEWRSTAGPGRSLESMQMSRICLDPGKIRRLREDWGHMVQMMQGLKAAADDIVWLKSKYFTSFKKYIIILIKMQDVFLSAAFYSVSQSLLFSILV